MMATAPRGLSVCQAERIVQKASLRSGVLKRVTPTEMNVLLGRLAMTLPALSLSNGP